MSEEPHEEQREDQHLVSLSQTLSFGAGTFLTVGVIDLVAHLGPTGLVIGGILAYIAAKQGPELANQAREALSSPPARQPEIEEPHQRGKRTYIHLPSARHPHSHLPPPQPTGPDTFVIPPTAI